MAVFSTLLDQLVPTLGAADLFNLGVLRALLANPLLQGLRICIAVFFLAADEHEYRNVKIMNWPSSLRTGAVREAEKYDLPLCCRIFDKRRHFDAPETHSGSGSGF